MWALRDMEGTEDTETEIINDPLDTSIEPGDISGDPE
jgi:hypothetical protein